MNSKDDDFNYDNDFKARARTGVATFLSTIKNSTDLSNDSQGPSSSSNVNTNSLEYLRGEPLSWASADFFPGEGKIFQGGAKTYYLPKKHLKTYYFSLKKSKNILFWPARGGQGPPLALPCGRPCPQVFNLNVSVVR